jgi:3-oxoacyl-[acyl-carrier protein] reductase
MAPEVQVNSVAPGFVKTRSYDGRTEEQIQNFIGQTYLKRWISFEEITEAYIFLAKDDAVTGQVIYVDAGFMLK